MIRTANILALSLALLACTGGEPVEPGADGGTFPAELHVGGADVSGTGFVAVTEGQDVELVPGSQAGFHVWTAARLTGASGLLFIEREARRADTGQLVLRSQRMALEVPVEAEDEMWETPAALPSFMCPSPIGIQVFDHEISFEVTLSDEDGNVLGTDSMTVTPRCPEEAGEIRDFCLEICAG